jgi:2-methylisocitrate lyase-like PEP mutase family enzyme
MSEQMSRTTAFRALHASGCFVMPNPWDAGSARLLAQMGFKALATTSAGFAWTRGYADNTVSLDMMLAHLREMVAATTLPLNADFEGGFAADPDTVGRNVTLAVATGVAGLSIEDSSGNADAPLFEFDLAVERIRAARAAIDRTGEQTMLTARCESYLVGRPDVEFTAKRLAAFAEAGADCVFAPGVRSLADICTLVKAVAPTPVNVLVGANFTTVAQLADSGVRRISVGGALARAAWTGAIKAAREIASHGTFKCFNDSIPATDLNGAFRKN